MRLFNACWINGEVPSDWKEAMIVPLYKGKGETSECCNYRRINLLNVVGKLYGRGWIERVKRKTNNSVSDEQCGFRAGRGCVNQIFCLKNLIEKSLE